MAGVKLESCSVIASITSASSANKCLVGCARNPDCFSVNHHNDNGFCELIGYNEAQSSLMTDINYSYYYMAQQIIAWLGNYYQVIVQCTWLWWVCKINLPRNLQSGHKWYKTIPYELKLGEWEHHLIFIWNYHRHWHRHILLLITLFNIAYNFPVFINRAI